jgi:superfamily II DNA or RNA helicase
MRESENRGSSRRSGGFVKKDFLTSSSKGSNFRRPKSGDSRGGEGNSRSNSEDRDNSRRDTRRDFRRSGTNQNSERGDNRRDFRRGDTGQSSERRDFRRSDSSQSGEKSENRREFNRNDSGRSFNRSEGRGEFRRDGGGRGFGRSNSRGGWGNRRSQPRREKGVDVSRFVRSAKEVVRVTYTPKHKFSDFDITPNLKKNIEFKKYESPTPIQDQSINHILEGKDLVGIANTGTGKTAAFIIPLIDKVYKDRNQKVLIIVPTRELALQIEDDFRTFSKFMNQYSVLCIGGADIRKQMYLLRRNPNFVIGTPGRLKDLIERRSLDLSKFNNIVLDEVDRMLDMGFIDDIKYLIAEMEQKRQSLFFSATLSREIQTLMRQFLKDDHVTVSVKTGETSDNIDQDIVKVSKDKKGEKLIELLGKPEFKKVLIFVNTKRGVDNLDEFLYETGFKVSSIHGDKTQYKRQQALFRFKKDQTSILIATDVAARGLDIPNVSHVINYDAPKNYEDYVHRIGRTGRGNNTGTALTFVGA